jgi:hypothetical protein
VHALLLLQVKSLLNNKRYNFGLLYIYYSKASFIHPRIEVNILCTGQITGKPIKSQNYTAIQLVIQTDTAL